MLTTILLYYVLNRKNTNSDIDWTNIPTITKVKSHNITGFGEDIYEYDSGTYLLSPKSKVMISPVLVRT